MLSAGMLWVAASPAGAAILQVDRFDDPPLGSSPTCTIAANDCSLRQAIELANQAGSSTTVELGAGVYQLTLTGASEDANQTGDLDFTSLLVDLQLQGAGAGVTIVEQTVADRVLQLHFGTDVVEIGGMTLRGGSGAGGGGAIASSNERLEIRDAVLADSSATNIGGCVSRLKGSNDHGAIFERVTFSGCTSGNTGGALYLEVAGDVAASEILASRFEDNQATGVAGAAYFSLMPLLTIEDTVFAGNVSQGFQTEQLGMGGGAYFFNLGAIVRRSAFLDNRAGSPGSQVGEGGAAVVEEAVVNFENVTFARNEVAGTNQAGGGLIFFDADVDLVHTTFTDSLANGQTTLRVEDMSAVELDNSVIDGGCSIGSGTVTSEHNNVERPWSGSSSSTCNLGSGDRLVDDLALRPPAIYGGPHGVPTQPPLPGSAAGGLVSSADCADDDARSAPRLGLFCDAGAHETNAVAPGPWIFADGFESADTLAWSVEVP